MLAPASTMAQTTTCENAIFVYVDISGSMYDLDENPRVVYEGAEMFLFDAMLKFASATFARPGVLREGDRFEVYGFAESVRSLAPPIRNYAADTDYETIRDLHATLDENGDDRVAYDADLGIPRRDIQKTNYPALLHDIQRKLRRYVERPGESTRHLATVVVLTDGVDEANVGELETGVDNLTRDFGTFFNNGQLNFIFLPLQDAPSTAPFARHPEIIVEEFYLRQDTRENEGLIEDVQVLIDQVLHGTKQFGEETVAVAIDEDEATFGLTIRSRSCSAEQVKEVTYRIVPSDGNGDVITRTVDVDTPLEAFGRSEVSIPVSLANLPEGDYTIEFKMQGVSGNASASFDVKTTLPGALIFFIFLVLVGLLFGGVMFYLMSKREQQTSIYEDYQP